MPTTPIFWTVCMGFLLIIPQQRCLELPTGLAHPIFKFLTISALPELKIVDLSVSTSPGDCLIYLSLGAIHGWQVYYMRPNLSVFKENSGGSLFVLFFCLLSLSLSLSVACFIQHLSSFLSVACFIQHQSSFWGPPRASRPEVCVSSSTIHHSGLHLGQVGQKRADCRD